MIGRGIDQILLHPSKPQLYEPYVTDAREYIFLAEQAHGKIIYPVNMNYIWGEALTLWKKFRPDVKIINLETAITQSDNYWPQKGIHYRMHPLNIGVLKAAGFDICTLANNHILDWGYAGLKDTMTALETANIKFSGIGENIEQAMEPTVFELPLKRRLLVFSAGTISSGVPPTWEATSKFSGLYYLPELSHDSLCFIAENIKRYKQPGDLIIFSIHWGSNWGYDIPESFRFFAHNLIDIAKVDVVFGHSSHHPRPIEMHQGKPILYGCGDFINDYEGIAGHEKYRDDLTFMYFLYFDVETLHFKKMTLIPLQIKKFSLHKANKKDSEWLLQTLNQYSPLDVQFIFEDQCLIYTNL